MIRIIAALHHPFYQRSGIRLRLDLHDWWWGVFWKRNHWPTLLTNSDHPGWQYHVFICLVPCLPLHVWWTRTSAKTWHELNAEIAARHETARRDRPMPHPDGPFAPPPDVPAIPEYDMKGIGPGWPVKMPRKRKRSV